jgi:mRNA interferase MazF
MRPIHLVRIDKLRPAVILTRESVRPYLRRITVAPITSTERGLRTEVPVGSANGLDHQSVISCDNVQTVEVGDIGRPIGHLTDDQEIALAHALATAYDLNFG